MYAGYLFISVQIIIYHKIYNFNEPVEEESDTYSLRPELSNIMSRILSDIEASYTNLTALYERKY